MRNTKHKEWHKRSLGEILRMLDTDVDLGLSPAKVADILEKYGPNELPVATVGKYFNLFDCTSFTLLITVLLCFSCLVIPLPNTETSIHYLVSLGVMLIIGAIIMTVFSFCLQSRSAKIVSRLCNAYPQYTTVLRSGIKFQENVSMVVVGDIVLLRPGDLVPADLRLIEASDLEMNEFALTGLVEPKRKNTKEFKEELLDSPNMAWFGSYCVKGYGKGIVVSTGLLTMIRYLMAKKPNFEKHQPSHVYCEMQRFILIFRLFAWFFGIILFGISLLKGINWFWTLIYLFTLGISIMPGFLLHGVTASLMLSTKRLASKMNLVKDMETIETLGLTSLICCSKAKFLTEDVLNVHMIWTDFKIVPAQDIKYHVDATEPIFSVSETTWSELCKTLYLLCFYHSESDRPQLSSLDDALLYFLSEYRPDVSELSRNYRKIFELPFDSQRKFHLCIHEEIDEESDDEDQKVHILSMKGAPEVILRYCQSVFRSGTQEWITETLSNSINEVLGKLLSTGEKVIGICNRQLSRHQMLDKYDQESVEGLLKNFRLVALVSLHDPIRLDAKETVEKCRKAGIKMSLVTGDHPTSAKWLAREVGILSAESETRDELVARLNISKHEVKPGCVPAIVIHGDELREIDPENLNILLSSHDEIIFARVSPDQKQGIVEAFQRQKMSVAITGVSPQDYAAMEKANIGIAMDKTSCELCKKAANLILLDNYFSTVLTSIEEGRLIFENLRKSILYVLACKIPQIFPYVLHLSLNIPLPLGEIFILLIFFETDMLPAMALLYEKSETRTLLKLPTVHTTKRLLSKTFVRKILRKSFGQFGITETMAGIFTYLIIMTENGFMPHDLVGISSKWNTPAINDLKDSFNQEWTYHARQELKNSCQTGFFVTIVILQMFTLIINRSNIDSLWSLGMRNYVINFSLMFQVLLTLLLIYLPQTNILFHISPIKFIWWFPGVPFGVFLLAFEELRSYYIRQSSLNNGWVERDV